MNDYNILEVARQEAQEVFKTPDRPEYQMMLADLDVDGGFD